jgi:hypothetical protein
MRNLFIRAFVALVFATTARAAEDRHVILITMDGFPAYVFKDPRAPVPTLRKLAAEGVSADGG